MTFEDYYASWQHDIKLIAQSFNRRYRVPEEDFISAMNEALWKEYKSSEGVPTQSHTRVALRSAAIDVMRGKQGGHYQRVFATLDKPADEDTPMSETADAETTEDVVFRRANVRRAHQLELIRSLVDKTDSPTIALVEAFLAAPDDAKPTQIAKSVGLHHNVADKKLQKLSRRLSANQVPELIDLMPKGKKIRPEFLSA